MKFLTDKIFKLAAIGLLLIAIELFSANSAMAQTDQPSGTLCQPGVVCQVGPYKIMVSFDRNSFDTTNEYVMAIQWQNGNPSGWQIQAAEVVPQPKTDAVAVKYDSGRFISTTDPNQKQIRGFFPISGDWWIHVTLRGAQGTADFITNATVAAPPTMPIWLAWVIGLSPILGIIGFFLGQWRLVVRRKREERQTSYSGVQ